VRHVLPFGLLALCCLTAAIGSPQAAAGTDEAGPVAVRRNPVVSQDPTASANEPGVDASASDDGRSWWPYAALAGTAGAAALLCAMALRRARA
jgi:hypothetical protein